MCISYREVPVLSELYPSRERSEVGFGALLIAPYSLGWELIKEGLASREISIPPLSRRVFNVVKGILLLVPVINYLFFMIFAKQIKEECKKSLEKYSEIQEDLRRAIHKANLSEDQKDFPNLLTGQLHGMSLSESITYPIGVPSDFPPMSRSLIMERPRPLQMKVLTYCLLAKNPDRKSLEGIANMLSKKALDILILQANGKEAIESLSSHLSDSYYKSELAYSENTPGQLILLRRGTFDSSIATKFMQNEKSCVLIAKARHKTSMTSLNVHNVFINKSLNNKFPYILQDPGLIDYAFEDPSEITIGGGAFHCGVDELNPLNYHFDNGTGISNPKAKIRDVHLFGSKHVKFSNPHVSYLVNNPSDQNPVLSEVEIAIN